MKEPSRRHLLVDGSNVMHAWPELRALLPRGRNAARSRLSAALAALHDAEGMRVTLVFDGRGSELSLERPSGQDTFVHAHTPAGLTADDVIERMVGQARDPGACVVASDDRSLRRTIEALGASGLSSEELAAWSRRASSRQSSGLDRLRRDNDGRWGGLSG